ncbi:MAG TPA: thioredoxin domain-containing protein, partial [Dongiaceae bacterium]|nr:thioredoxin domain-containing protein [Dongiaceae bacterium]
MTYQRLLRPLRGALLGLAAAFGIAAGAAAQEPLTPAQIEAFENVVRDYLLRNPEVIVEAMRRLEARQQELEAEQARQAIAQRQDELLRDPMAPVVGAPDAAITVVEFFDYRCPYCKSVAEDMVATLEAEGDVRIVFKEFPILGPE